MGATYFTREFTDAIMRIAYELEKMNELKEKEIKLLEKEKKGVNNVL